MKDVNEMSPDEFDLYIQSQGFATSHKVAAPQKTPEDTSKSGESEASKKPHSSLRRGKKKTSGNHPHHPPPPRAITARFF